MAIPERVVESETLARTVEKYLPSKEILEAYPFPDPISLDRKAVFEDKHPGSKYSLVYFHREGKLVIVPTWHPINTTPIPTHGGDYASGAFEGHSLEPVVKDGEIVGANLILHEKRMARLKKSVEARDFSLPVSLSELSQGISDLASILGEDILRSPAGVPCRAYVRPEARPGAGGLGLGVKKDHQIDTSVLCWNWPSYFTDPERVYQGSGLVAIAFPEQRLEKITGKHASNYGAAGTIGNRARALGGDEAIYFGPYLVRPVDRKMEDIQIHSKHDISELLRFGVLADGPGEEIFAITSSGEIWYPPMNVNKLGGTTLNYLIEHIAPNLNIVTRERPFNLLDIETGLIVSLLFAGNAARLAPIGEVRVFGGNSQEPWVTVHLTVSPIARRLMARYEAEVRAQIAPSHPSLLTPVDLSVGKQARKVLDKVYKKWM